MRVLPAPTQNTCLPQQKATKISLMECQDLSSHPSACDTHIIHLDCMTLYRQRESQASTTRQMQQHWQGCIQCIPAGCH